jgi:DnaK suppressor protein
MSQHLAAARDRLMRLREALLQMRGEHREGEAELLGVREPDPGDAAAAEGGAIPLDSLNGSEQQQLVEVDAALARVGSGEYGVCEQCDEPIEEGRLEAVPWARRCFQCESQFEKAHRAVHVV